MVEHNDMYEVLNIACDKLNFNEVVKLSYEELDNLLVDLGLFKDSKSIKLFLVTEGLNCIYNQEYSHPITFLEKDENIPDEERFINENGLTNEYINDF